MIWKGKKYKTQKRSHVSRSKVQGAAVRVAKGAQERSRKHPAEQLQRDEPRLLLQRNGDDQVPVSAMKGPRVLSVTSNEADIKKKADTEAGCQQGRKWDNMKKARQAIS